MDFCDCNQCRGIHLYGKSTRRQHRKIYGIFIEKKPRLDVPSTSYSQESLSPVVEDDAVVQDPGDHLYLPEEKTAPDEGPEDLTIPVEEDCNEASMALDKSTHHQDVEINEESFICHEEAEKVSSSLGQPHIPGGGHLDSIPSNDNDERELEDLYFPLITWFSLLFMKMKLYFNISNSASNVLICIVAVFLACLSHPVHRYFPKNLKSMHSWLDLDKFDTVLYVVCPNSSCNALYPVVDGKLAVDVCTSEHYGKQCNEHLVYQKRLSFGKERSTPHKTFTFTSPSSWLKKMFQKEEFLSLLSERMKERSDDDTLYDIWDGKVWKEFLNDPLTPTQPFLKKKSNIAFMMNVDWVKPFVRGTYKVGAIYLTILNLPRRERFKEKWSCLIGLMPGPDEPKQNMNTYLKPLVDNLLDLWRGVDVQVNNEDEQVRAALICVSCDLPASRKVSQFLGHKANKGCSRCTFQAERERDKETGTCTGRMSYHTKSLQFDNRKPDEVREHAIKWKYAPNANQAKDIAKINGVRYSELLRLPYFDLPRMCVIDPMHAFLLGLVESEAELHFYDDADNPLFKQAIPLSKRKEFCKRLKNVTLPSDLGRLPVTMPEKNSLNSLTADQWKNYALYYARPCLLDLIPGKAYESMKLLCEIIEIVAQNYLTRKNISVLRDLLLKHHHLFSSVYGKWKVSINYHLALHMPEIFEDFGPSPVFWCFAYERLNGLVVDCETNNKSVEVQLTEAYLLANSLKHKEAIAYPAVVTDLLMANPFVDKILTLRKETNPLVDREDSQRQRFRAANFFEGNRDLVFVNQRLVERQGIDLSPWPIELLPPTRYDTLVSDQMHHQLSQYFSEVYNEELPFVSARINKWARCKVNGTCFSSDLNRSDRSSFVVAYWAINESPGICKYYGRVRFFFTVGVILSDGSSRTHELAYVDWATFFNRNHGVHQPSGLVALKKTFYKTDNLISVRRLLNRVLFVPHKNMILAKEI